MPDTERFDRTFHFILETFVARGYAPHYAEIGRAFGGTPEKGRQLLRELMATGLPNWVFPDTDLIASFAPFSNLPTQYRISVDGRQAWFAQCGFETIAVSWVFPGKPIVVDSLCLDCGEPLRLTVRDGVVQGREPPSICAFVDVPARAWRVNLPNT